MTSSGNGSYQIDVQVFEQFEQSVRNDMLMKTAERTLALEMRGSSEAVSIVIADDATVRELNRTHRGLDENTDVLSFAFSHAGEYYGDDEPMSEWSEDASFVMPPGDSAGLGEVIISYPQMARQAEEAGHSNERELVHLLTHGILHLLGYDHVETDDETIMNARETEILAQVFRDE